MSAVVGRYRPSAAEVRPGTEPYERVIRALRGEPWNKGFGATRTEEQRPQRPPVYTSTPICMLNTQTLQPRLLESIISDNPCVVEAVPPAKRTRNEVVEVEQQTSTIEPTYEGPSANNTSIDHNTSSEKPFEQYVTGPVDPTTTVPSTIIPTATSCTTRLTQKLQNIAQLDDEVVSSKTQSKAKYKPPYKIIKNSKPGDRN